MLLDYVSWERSLEYRGHGEEAQSTHSGLFLWRLFAPVLAFTVIIVPNNRQPQIPAA